MVKVYAVVLALGVIGLLVVILGGAFAANTGNSSRDPGERFGMTGKILTGAAVGFGMGGISAEFAPLGFTWQVSLVIAVGAALLAVVWVRYATGRSVTG